MNEQIWNEVQALRTKMISEILCATSDVAFISNEDAEDLYNDALDVFGDGLKEWREEGDTMADHLYIDVYVNDGDIIIWDKHQEDADDEVKLHYLLVYDDEQKAFTIDRAIMR